MSMERIDFNHFFLEIRDFITLPLLKKINPNTLSFWKCGGIYLALCQEPNTIVVHTAIRVSKENRISWVNELNLMCKQLNLRYVKFYTSQFNTTVIKIAEYCKAEQIDRLKDYYSENEDGLVFLVDSDEGRFKK